MWIPASAAEIERAATARELRETASFDAKKTLPIPARNECLAVDVAAMSTDGGVLLYGVGEDRSGQPVTPSPIPLAGAKERVDQIVQTSIAEAPHIEIREYPTGADASVGYLLVVIPQSARAPHQVTVGGNLRFYGRGATGNRVLTEGEIARLYERRRAWEQDAEDCWTEPSSDRDSPRRRIRDCSMPSPPPFSRITRSGIGLAREPAVAHSCSPRLRRAQRGPKSPLPTCRSRSGHRSENGRISALIASACRRSPASKTRRTRPCTRSMLMCGVTDRPS